MSKIVVNKSVGPVSLPGLLLKPGANALDEEQSKIWASFEDHQNVKLAIEHKTLVVEEVETDVTESLEKMKIPEAVALVAQTLDVAKLRKWGDSEKRPSVSKAISDKLGEIEAKGKK
ncbi:MAG: hypothetical protein E6Q97_04980 [Desulfurellales bacterium]|nr:MAG: hypothetical protein E6Q97_04980 [Desulfurellales bacterium]